MGNDVNRHTFFFFNDTATTEIYTLSLHDALPISMLSAFKHVARFQGRAKMSTWLMAILDRKSTRLNSSHQIISYAVFCLKKKKQHNETQPAIDALHGMQLSPYTVFTPTTHTIRHI